MLLGMFFAVTTTSLYQIEWTPGQPPTIQKIAKRESARSKIHVGESFEPLGLLAVTADGLICYTNSERRQPLEMVNISRWGGGTSPIVALFLDEDDAYDCLDSRDIKRLDPRWRDETETVLAAIGQDHPVFTLSDHKCYAFRYEDEAQ